MAPQNPLPAAAIVVFDGFDDLDAVAPFEILSAAGFPVRLVRPPAHPPRVTSAHGLVAEVPRILGEATDLPGDRTSLVIVPGGGWLDGSPSGVRSQCEGELPGLLARLSRDGAVVASVCTGAMLLAAAGLLEGRPAVTNRHALDDLAAAGAEVQAAARVVDAGNVVTCGGPAAGLDLGIALVTRFAGGEAAAAAADRLEHQPVGPVVGAA